MAIRKNNRKAIEINLNKFLADMKEIIRLGADVIGEAGRLDNYSRSAVRVLKNSLKDEYDYLFEEEENLISNFDDKKEFVIYNALRANSKDDIINNLIAIIRDYEEIMDVKGECHQDNLSASFDEETYEDEEDYYDDDEEDYEEEDDGYYEDDDEEEMIGRIKLRGNLFKYLLKK